MKKVLIVLVMVGIIIALESWGMPDNKPKIAFVSERDGNAEIYVMDADGKNQTNLTKNQADDWSPAWSPDGTKIAFMSWRDDNWEIYVMDADGKNQKRLTKNDADNKSPAWSPDGSKIAFVSKLLDNAEIYVMDADGKNRKRLTKNKAVDESPAWNPDGTKIAFESCRDGNGEIYVVDADGKNQKRLTETKAFEKSPAWSPDGTNIAFVSGLLANAEIYVMDADGKNQKRLTKNQAQDGSPVWNPDGTKIAFESCRDGNWEIYVMDSDGRNQKRLTENEADDESPVWSPSEEKTSKEKDISRHLLIKEDINGYTFVKSSSGKHPVVAIYKSIILYGARYMTGEADLGEHEDDDECYDYERAVEVWVLRYENISESFIKHELSRFFFGWRFTMSFAPAKEVIFRFKCEDFKGQKVARAKGETEWYNVIWWNKDNSVIVVITAPPEVGKPVELINSYLKRHPSNLQEGDIPKEVQKERDWFKKDLERMVKELRSKKVEIRDWIVGGIMELTNQEFKRYECTKSLKEQEEGIREIEKWYADNKEYLIWNWEKCCFTIDQEAKKAGIPTEEYRKIHPWSKEGK